MGRSTVFFNGMATVIWPTPPSEVKPYPNRMHHLMGSVHSVSQWHGHSHVTNATPPPPDIKPYPNRLHSLAGLVDGVLQQHGNSHGTNTTSRRQTLPWQTAPLNGLGLTVNSMATVMGPTPPQDIKPYPDRLHSSVGLVNSVLQQHGDSHGTNTTRHQTLPVMGPPPQDILPCHGHETHTNTRRQIVPRQTPQLGGPGQRCSSTAWRQSWDQHHKTANLAMVTWPTPPTGIKPYPNRHPTLPRSCDPHHQQASNLTLTDSTARWAWSTVFFNNMATATEPTP